MHVKIVLTAALLVITFTSLQVAAQNSTNTTSSAGCAQLFSLPTGQQCTACQTTIYTYGQQVNPSDQNSPYVCDSFGRFEAMVIADNPSVSTGTSIDTSDLSFTAVETKKFCALQNPCDSATAVKGYQQIQANCKTEAQANNQFAQQVLYLHSVLYYSTPDYQTTCQTDGGTGYSWIDVSNQESNYVQQTVGKSLGGSSLYVNYQVTPPSTIVYYSTIGPSRDDYSLKVPSSIVCGAQFQTLAKIYTTYNGANAVDPVFAATLTQVNQMKANMSSISCANVNTNLIPTALITGSGGFGNGTATGSNPAATSSGGGGIGGLFHSAATRVNLSSSLILLVIVSSIIQVTFSNVVPAATRYYD